MASKDKATQLNSEDEFAAWLDKPPVKQPKSRAAVEKKRRENISRAKSRQKATEKRAQTQKERLTPRERRFCQLYVETGKAAQSIVDAGYNVSNLGSASVLASHMLEKAKIKAEILRLQSPGENKAIATAQEVMERFTAIARGEDKDQFGLEISAADRLKALIELAKRTVDVEQRMAGKPDATVEIKLDWKRDE